MPPAAWSGQWVSNAGGHQSRDLNPVFIAGKRLFADRDKWGQNRPPARLIDRGDRPLSRNPATSRSFTVSSGNLSSRKTAWWAREDSNLQPSGYYEPFSADLELRAAPWTSWLSVEISYTLLEIQKPGPGGTICFRWRPRSRPPAPSLFANCLKLLEQSGNLY